VRMVRDTETILDEALRCCFRPHLPDDECPSTRAELQELAEDYRAGVGNGIQAFRPVRKWEEPDAEYLERCKQVQFPPPHKGRPKAFAADVLVLFCRAMLIRHGCTYSASGKRTYESPLVKLAKLVHELAGLPPRDGWQKRAEKTSDPLWRMQLILGKEAAFSSGMSKEEKQKWNREEVRPPKRGK